MTISCQIAEQQSGMHEILIASVCCYFCKCVAGPAINPRQCCGGERGPEPQLRKKKKLKNVLNNEKLHEFQVI